MRFDIRTLDEITDDEREARRDAERTAHDEWLAETADWTPEMWDEWLDQQSETIPADVRAWR